MSNLPPEEMRAHSADWTWGANFRVQMMERRSAREEAAQLRDRLAASERVRRQLAALLRDAMNPRQPLWPPQAKVDAALAASDALDRKERE